MKIREYVYCVKCSSDITWNANDPNDDNYGGVLDKLEHHQEGLECIREQKLRTIENFVGISQISIDNFKEAKRLIKLEKIENKKRDK